MSLDIIVAHFHVHAAFPAPAQCWKTTAYFFFFFSSGVGDSDMLSGRAQGVDNNCQCTILDLLQRNMHCFGVAENELGLY